MTNDNVKKFWEEGACGEQIVSPAKQFWLTEQEASLQLETRYRLEPHIHSFADFQSCGGKRILEVGLGLGADHQMFASNAPMRLVGVDLTEKAVQYCRNRLAIYGLESELRVIDAEDPRLLQLGEFDIIYSYGVIHHSSCPTKILSNFSKMLASDGVLKIMIYNKYSLVMFYLWVRYSLLTLKFLSLEAVASKYLESPGTKIYSVSEAMQLLSPFFKKVNISIVLSHGDLLSGNVGQRHRGILLSSAKLVIPRWFLRKFANKFGLFLLISAAN